MWSLLFSLAFAQSPTWPELTSVMGESSQELRKDSALIIGLEDYAQVPDVPGAAKNATDWRRYFATRGMPLSRIKLLENQYATKEGMLMTADEVADITPNGGTVWLVYIGHGAPAPDGKDGLLVGWDAQGSAIGLMTRSVSRSEILARLSDRQGPTVAILDACFSGKSGSSSMLAKDLQPLLATQLTSVSAVTVLSAGRSDEFAGPLPGLGRPAFSYLALGALLGWGDENSDGTVMASEAVAYANGALSALVKDRRQQPQLAGEDLTLGGGGASGPDLLAMADSAVASGGEVTTGGDFGSIQLDVSDKLAEQQCAKFAEQDALQARDAKLSDAVSALQEEATTSWTRLKPQLSPCLALQDRSQCVEAVETWISHVDGLKAQVSSGVHVAKTECGDRQFAYQGTEAVVSIRELSEAKEWFSKLTGRAIRTGPQGPVVSRVKAKGIPSGRFEMGSTRGEPNEAPAHSVTVSSFEIMTHEVTRLQYHRVTESRRALTGCTTCPAEGVSWYQAVKFANAQSELDGLEPAYVINGTDVEWNQSSNGWRLPTEAEWEYAARGGESFIYAGSDDIKAVAWFKKNSRRKHQPVCSQKTNGYGLCDMSGNVSEWVWDGYGAYPSGEQLDPIGPVRSTQRVYRGGDGLSRPSDLTVTARGGNPPAAQSFWRGFRLARSTP